jgi:hypothetical protein
MQSKGTDMSVRSQTDLDAIAFHYNAKPCRSLGWKSPAEMFCIQAYLISKPVGEMAPILLRLGLGRTLHKSTREKSMINFLGTIISLMIKIILLPVALIIGILSGILKAVQSKKSRLLFTAQEQSLLAKAQKVINMNNHGAFKPDGDLLEVAECIDSARYDYQKIKDRERFDTPFIDYVTSRVNQCNVKDWDNVIDFFEYIQLAKPKKSYKTIDEQESEWIHKLWEWADRRDIENHNIPRDRGDLLSLEHLSFASISYYKRAKFNLLPKEIGYLKKIKFLELGSASHPEIHLSSVLVLPKEIFNLTELTRLHLQNNSLIELPIEIGKLVNLKELKLGGNLIASLPSEIGNLSKLEVLTAWSNSLKCMPSEIGLLTNLKGLSLWGNSLITLPEEITNLKSLRKLELGSNPKLILSPIQKIWIRKLSEDGCEISIDNMEELLGSDELLEEPRDTIVRSQREWLLSNPFLTDEEAQNLADNPPKRKKMPSVVESELPE